MNTHTAVYVIIGLSADKKPHAARFEEGSLSQAAKATKLMGFRLGKAASDEARSLAKMLPKGRIFTQGRALVPITKATLYEQLGKQLEFLTAAALEAAMQPPFPTVDAAKVWDGLEVGQMVLYGGKLSEDGWWETIVVGISSDKSTLTLRWRGAMHEPAFKAYRGEIAVVLPFPDRESELNHWIGWHVAVEVVLTIRLQCFSTSKLRLYGQPLEATAVASSRCPSCNPSRRAQYERPASLLDVRSRSLVVRVGKNDCRAPSRIELHQPLTSASPRKSRHAACCPKGNLMDNAAKVRELNDQLRVRLNGGQLFITSGVAGNPALPEILEKVRAFNEFSPDNDPHGEHDFGSFEHGGQAFFWKIDYYDKDLQFASPDPGDPAVTCRV